MLKKSVSILIAAGVLTMGIAAFAQAEDTETTLQTRERARTMEHSQAAVGTPPDEAAGDMTMTQERKREQKKDGTGDMVKDQLRTRDRIHEPGTGSGAAAGRGSGMSGGRGR
ncbi:MAG: hypothetical protein A2X58_11850 [Nitrospirae bacterium GWC2_56_14]|nr:MAG: hypothetical protein A2X58_11850 [Nitrospirae bacterium GWC2_56_14]